MPSQLYGIYGEHAQESCPLYNRENRRWLLANASEQGKTAQKFRVRILQQYHSALEHTFLWIAEAENPHLIEELMARTAGRFNTLRIVPLVTFQTVLDRSQKIEDGSFFEN